MSVRIFGNFYSRKQTRRIRNTNDVGFGLVPNGNDFVIIFHPMVLIRPPTRFRFSAYRNRSMRKNCSVRLTKWSFVVVRTLIRVSSTTGAIETIILKLNDANIESSDVNTTVTNNTK